jgi:hypothetical protein
MYSFLKYNRNVKVPTVVTTFGSEEQEKGQTMWNMMTFDVKRVLTNEELQDVKKNMQEIVFAVRAEKGNKSINTEESAPVSYVKERYAGSTEALENF